MKLYTRTGDGGETGLIGGARVPKHHPRIRACGEIDELTAALGVVVSGIAPDRAAGVGAGPSSSHPSSSQPSPSHPLPSSASPADALRGIQSDLFALGAQLANPTPNPACDAIGPAHVERLERWIDAATADVEPLACFILPGGCEPAARLHWARAVCRRAERAVVALLAAESADPSESPESADPACAACATYLNRLGDLLFALARRANHDAGVADIPWVAPRETRP